MEILKHSTPSDETTTIRKKMSRADVKLKEIEQQLQNSQEHLDYIKKRLAYMTNVYEERRLINSEGFGNLSANSSYCGISFVQDQSDRSSTNGYETSHNALSNREDCYEDMRSFYSYMSKPNSIKSIVVNNDEELISSKNEFPIDKHVVEDKKPSVTKITTKVCSYKHLNSKNGSEGKMSISTNESSNSSHNLDHLKDLEPQEIFKPFPPTPASDKKSQLILKINAAHEETLKQDKTNELDKMKKPLSHANLAINKQPQLNEVRDHNRPIITKKVRKLKLKVPSLDHLVAKNRKKFRRRALINRKRKNFLLKSSTKNLEKRKILNKHNPTPDVVELYHNTATNNTTPSIESSKHYIESQNQMHHEAVQQIQNSMTFISNRVIGVNSMNSNFVNSPKETFHQLNLEGQFSEAGIQDSFSRKKEKPDEPQTEDHDHRRENCHSRSFRSYYGEFIATGKNYQQPTIASKLKKVEKCYGPTKFDLGNIPFSNGTSLSPSHNVGLNVQQVISQLKTKQHQITPNFQDEPINKSGKTFNSVVKSLLDTLNTNSDNTNTNSMIQSKSLVYSSALQEVDNATTKVEKFKETAKIKQKKPPAIHNTKNSSTDTKIIKRRNSLLHYQNFSRSETFENTMRKIHNRFDVLHKKYEHLQNQLLKTNDKKLKKELTQVENQLSEKEEELNALLGLCFEVATLQRQMKMQHNSSLLYITTECSTHNFTKINSSTTARPQNSHSLHITEYQQRKTPISKKTPPNTKIFAGLLRNIQSIQHQLTTI